MKQTSRRQKIEGEWNDQLLNILLAMVGGLLVLIVATYRSERNSQTFKFKMGAFMVYELCVYMVFVAVYMKGLYLSVKDDFTRKKVDPNGSHNTT